MNCAHRQQIGQAFSGARDYDSHARLQRHVARNLADQIAALRLPARPRILEIGCGTGFLTEALIERGVDGRWLITDISPAMVDRCRQRIGGGPDRRFAVLDGEYGVPDVGEGFDLICSSLAMQWFDDQDAALARMLTWLTAEGQCLFTTLGAGTFAEWRAAHAAAALPSGVQDFPTVSRLSAMSPKFRHGALRVDHHVEKHGDAFDFLRSLKAIGAHTAAQSHRPLQPAALRRVMHAFEGAGASVTYEVVTGHFGSTAKEAA